MPDQQKSTVSLTSGPAKAPADASPPASVDAPPLPKIGNGKTYASVLGGAIALILVFVLTSNNVAIPTDVAQAIQLIVTTLLVVLVPHSFWSGQ